MDVDTHTASLLTSGIDHAAVIFHNGSRLCQTQAVSADAVRSLVIQFKDVLRFGRCQALPVVLHNDEEFLLDTGDGDLQCTFLAHVFNGIVDDIFKEYIDHGGRCLYH